jgi:hypothetical protein
LSGITEEIQKLGEDYKKMKKGGGEEEEEDDAEE